MTNTATIDGRRFRLEEIPSTLAVRFEGDYDTDWSWVGQEEMAHAWTPDPDSLYGVAFGDFGPIDADGNEHAALLALVERVWEDGHRELVDALGGITVPADDRSLIGITDDGPFGVDDLRAWSDHDDERGYVAQTVLDFGDFSEA